MKDFDEKTKLRPSGHVATGVRHSNAILAQFQPLEKWV
jgi:hypothetical protein